MPTLYELKKKKTGEEEDQKRGGDRVIQVIPDLAISLTQLIFCSLFIPDAPRGDQIPLLAN